MGKQNARLSGDRLNLLIGGNDGVCCDLGMPVDDYDVTGCVGKVLESGFIYTKIQATFISYGVKSKSRKYCVYYTSPPIRPTYILISIFYLIDRYLNDIFASVQTWFL